MAAGSDLPPPVGIVLDGCNITHYPSRTSRPAVLLVHGFAAHEGWWDPILPLLGNRAITTLDLSGHGDSAHREEYSPERWAQDILLAADHVGDVGTLTVIGHSLGGLCALVAAKNEPDRFRRLVIIDSLLRRPLPECPQRRRGSRRRRPFPYFETEAEAVEHIRPVPPQPVADEQVWHVLRQRSVVQEGSHWRLKADWRMFGVFTDQSVHDYLAGLKSELVLIGGARSPSIDNQAAAYVAENVGRPVRLTSIPDAYHHVMLDQPECLAATLLHILEGSSLDPPSASPHQAKRAKFNTSF